MRAAALAIQNSTTVQTDASFNIDGTGAVGSNLAVGGNLAVTGTMFGGSDTVGYIQSPNWSNFTGTSNMWVQLWSGTVSPTKDSTFWFSVHGHFYASGQGCYATVMVDGVALAATCGPGNPACFGTPYVNGGQWSPFSLTKFAQLAAGTHTVGLAVYGYNSNCTVNGARIDYAAIPR